MNSTNRRSFLKAAAGTIVSIAALPVLRLKNLGTAFAADAARKPLPETLDLAKNLGYKADATKVDPKKRAEKAGIAGNKQFCSGCNFYSGNDKSGPCTMFAGYDVNAKGWCSVWTAKAPA